MKSARSVVTGVSFVLVGGVLAMAGLAKLLQRDEFKSVASVEAPELRSASPGPYFIVTEFQTIQSQPVLSNAIASLSLNERWGKKYNHGRVLSESETEEMVKRHLELRVVRNTRFVNIIAYSDDPEEAAKLANAVSQSYRQLRWEETKRRAEEAEKAGLVADPIVTVMDSAIPEFRPVRPNRYLAGAMVGCGIFLMIVGIVYWSDDKAQLAA